VPAASQVAFAFVISAVLALVFEEPFGLTYGPAAVGSVLWLGIFGSGLAYLAFFRLLRTWGATRTTLVSYLMPVVGITLGALIGEPVTVAMIAGTVLVIGGIGLVNLRSGPGVLLRRATGRAADRTAS
jgi:drug/metabolite transporter (DMT)-like permease